MSGVADGVAEADADADADDKVAVDDVADEEGRIEDEDDDEFDFVPRTFAIVTACWVLPTVQQSVVSPQHHFSEVLVPSHGVSCTELSAFS